MCRKCVTELASGSQLCRRFSEKPYTEALSPLSFIKALSMELNFLPYSGQPLEKLGSLFTQLCHS